MQARSATVPEMANATGSSAGILSSDASADTGELGGSASSAYPIIHPRDRTEPLSRINRAAVCVKLISPLSRLGAWGRRPPD
jgi:hypothetical protein